MLPEIDTVPPPRSYEIPTLTEQLAGRIVAEFDCGKDARDYAKAHGYTVTPGINYLFAVREVTP